MLSRRLSVLVGISLALALGLPAVAAAAPTARYVYSPSNPAVGTAVTFDASSSSCDRAPCTYLWEEDGPDGPGGAQLRLGTGVRLSSTFLTPGSKAVRLTVTNRRGRTSSTVQTISVEATPPQPPTLAEYARGKSASASSSDGYAPDPAMANDGNSATRWSSNYTDGQWWRVDLGGAINIERLEIDWEAAFPSQYKVQASLDGQSFTDVATVNSDGAGDEVSFARRSARYVRVLGVTRATQWGISAWAIRVYGPQGQSTPPPPPPPPPPPVGEPFPIGVWLQDPTRVRNGLINAVNFKNAGINVFVGLWSFPSDSGGYPGWSVNRMNALKANGLRAIAGTSTSWIASHPEFADTLQGYVLGDEPDMLRVNQAPGGSDWPDPWKQRGDAIKAADPGRDRLGQFGKGFCMYPWVGYDSRGDEALDFPKYVDPTTIVSSDCYSITDPYEALSWHGIYRYGRNVDNTEFWTGGRPMWSFIEASQPFTNGKVANNIAGRMPPSLIMPAVWMTVIHGADGIEYFCHDFANGGLIEDGCLNDPGMPAAMTAANASVQKYGGVLQTPDVAGTVVTTTGSVPVTTLTKRANGATYVFAIGDGTSSAPNGQAVDATITVAGGGDGTVQVLDEGRTLQMSGGRFVDHFGAYEHHVYRIGG